MNRNKKNSTNIMSACDEKYTAIATAALEMLKAATYTNIKTHFRFTGYCN